MTSGQYKRDMLILVDAMMDAQNKWAEAKNEYARVKRSYTGHLKPGSAEYKIAEYNASKDVRITKAIADCTYYRNEAQANAAIISALNSVNWK